MEEFMGPARKDKRKRPRADGLLEEEETIYELLLRY
jgi:hypothetical protein